VTVSEGGVGWSARRWVPAFLEQILAARKKEEVHVMKELKMFGWIITAVIVTPQFATMLTYLAYTLPSNVALNAPDAFAGLALFNILRFPLMKLGDAVTRWVACALPRVWSPPPRTELRWAALFFTLTVRIGRVFDSHTQRGKR